MLLLNFLFISLTHGFPIKLGMTKEKKIVIPPSFVIPVKTGIQDKTIKTLKTNKKFKTAIMLLLNFLFILLTPGFPIKLGMTRERERGGVRE